MPRDTEQIREKKQDPATTVETSVARMRGFGDYEIDDTASTLKSRDYKDVTDIVVQQES
jgi:hypothetical protein